MASPLLSRAPQCMSCIRWMTGNWTGMFLAPGHQQVRGKKKHSKVNAVTVRLLKDTKSYGRKGTLLSVPPGLMRNEWYPLRAAEYVTPTQITELGLENKIVERDFTFGKWLDKKAHNSLKESQVTMPSRPILVEYLSPKHAMEIISNLLPANLDFYRTPISVPEPPPQRYSLSVPATSAVSAAALEAIPSAAPAKTNIYGSVSTMDIATNLKAILAEDEEGSRVVLSHEEISFVEEADDKDRVKHLGTFEIEIKLKGAPDVVRRSIKVNPQN